MEKSVSAATEIMAGISRTRTYREYPSASPTSAKRRCGGVDELGTVLANEEVIDGKSEVGGFPVVRKPMRQWMLRITAYAERLLARSRHD